ncbi:MAG TPA: sigma-54 dependent transcriptional regulator [Thermoanaerobaculia bacterium]|nr:sigma-54 dependent transcriptional regulator [Thermoanaerobaculia bacterium]HUM30769.1 sigma-54 dependent transcriptional regulator [Thermoanaerobaculia bacterium]HXK69031.1 sigma-54 dependent transcriptional regulator [Thermoanaerobaculia bacterium]
MNPGILLVDDDSGIQASFSTYLARSGFTVTQAVTLAEAREQLLHHRFDAILLDLHLPDGNGSDWIPEIRETIPDIAVIVITGSGDISTAVEAMRLGADHFLTKPVSMPDLVLFLNKSLEVGTLRKWNRSQRRQDTRDPFFWGTSTAMRKIRELANVASRHASPVFLRGETGTGKGLLARWIHDQSDWSRSPFVEVNCSSLKGDLLASELFGHTRGAFTSAVRDRQGLIELADGGTLFLDEIGDMDLEVQAQFLKVIEEKQYRRLGDVTLRRSEFRLICATNRDLPHQLKEGIFREDLYFRIHVFPIEIPPLRERREDIPGLVQYMLERYGAGGLDVDPVVRDQLSSYPWPGNVREMRNLIERAVLLSTGNELTLEHFPGLGGSRESLPAGAEVHSLREQERQYVRRIFTYFGSDADRASKALGISRATLYRKLK